MRPQDIVAIILAVGVIVVLLSATNISLLWMTSDEVVALREGLNDEVMAALWKDVINVILGALAGYIAARGRHD